MIAKLFNNISPRNLLNAILLIFLLSTSFWLFPFSEWQWYPKSKWNWPLGTAGLSYSALVIITLLCSWLFAESENRRRIFDGHYLRLVIAGAFLWLWLYPLNAGAELWTLLLHFLLISATLPMLQSENKGSSWAFLAGLSLGVSSFLEGESLSLLLIPFLILAAVRHLNGRTFLALILGFGSTLYFAFSLDYFWDWNLFPTWLEEVTNLEFFGYDSSFKRIAPLIIVGVFWVLTVLIILSKGHLFNNEQRKEINYWMFLGFAAIGGFFLFANSNFWLGLSIWPAASLGSLAVRSIENRWLKDFLFLLPFIAYLSTFFFI